MAADTTRKVVVDVEVSMDRVTVDLVSPNIIQCAVDELKTGGHGGDCEDE
jgi:hypothetical protein